MVNFQIDIRSKEALDCRIKLELTTPIDDDRPILLSGNFNDWNIEPDKYQLRKIGPNRYVFILQPHRFSLPTNLEYKYLKGSWGNEELDTYARSTPNRIIDRLDKKVSDFVPFWRKNGLMYNSSYLPEKVIISEAFEIPQLIKTRRIAALLPHDYYETDRRYPVLYLQDGQNLFDEYAPFGNWGIDKKLAVLAEQGRGNVIIVAIDHAQEERIAEFTPSHQTKIGRGEGKKYIRFLADTLKPYVDKHFRTLHDRLNTGIGGSSMGGLISIYAGLMYPEVYSKIMLFSPSFWVDPDFHLPLARFIQPTNLKIYLYGGRRESPNMVKNLLRFKETLERQGMAENIDFKLSIDPNGMHNEARWGEEFPIALDWLFS